MRDIVNELVSSGVVVELQSLEGCILAIMRDDLNTRTTVVSCAVNQGLMT